jgi:hypothetical protein
VRPVTNLPKSPNLFEPCHFQPKPSFRQPRSRRPARDNEDVASLRQPGRRIGSRGGVASGSETVRFVPRGNTARIPLFSTNAARLTKRTFPKRAKVPVPYSSANTQIEPPSGTSGYSPGKF